MQLDRLSRDFQSLAMLEKLIREQNAKIFTLDGNYSNDEGSLMHFYVASTLNRWYSNTLSQSIKRGLRASKARKQKAIAYARVSSKEQIKNN